MTQKCPQCDAAVTDDLPGGMCPACLMAIARKSMKSEGGDQQFQPDLMEAPSLNELGELFPELEIVSLCV